MPDLRIPEGRYWLFAVGVGCRQDARSALVAGEPDALLLNPFGLASDAIAASIPVEVDKKGWTLTENGYELNQPGFNLHSGIIFTSPHITAIIHTHTLDGAMNHGTQSVGAIMGEAFFSFYLCERACIIQVRALTRPARHPAHFREDHVGGAGRGAGRAEGPGQAGRWAREDAVHSKHAALAAALQGLGMTLAFSGMTFSVPNGRARRASRDPTPDDASRRFRP